MVHWLQISAVMQFLQNLPLPCVYCQYSHYSNSSLHLDACILMTAGAIKPIRVLRSWQSCQSGRRCWGALTGEVICDCQRRQRGACFEMHRTFDSALASNS